MAALTAVEKRDLRNTQAISRGRYAVKTSAVIYQGSLVSRVKSTGRAVASTAAVSRPFLGIAAETKTGNTGGTVYVEVYWNCEALIDKTAALTTAYGSADAFISDDQTVTTGSGSGTAAIQTSSRVGAVIEIASSTTVWVDLRRNSARAT